MKQWVRRTSAKFPLTNNIYREYLQGEILDLFEVLRKQILNLDASVIEEFKKRYIAYKTTTNFVNIAPHMEFEEIKDPKILCRDIKNVGHWGNGDVEVNLSSIEQIDDVMILVCQAFGKYSEDLAD